MTVQVVDAARYLNELSGWRLSNLAMQKILYLADMLQTGATGYRLVDEPFQAWDYGPVLPSLYQRCKAFGSKPVPDVFWGASAIAQLPEGQVLRNAWAGLQDQTPGQLVDNTHWQGGAWAKRYVPGGNVTITAHDMIDEYRGRIAAQAPPSTHG